MSRSPKSGPSQYAVFLRGVNVGGIKIEMAKLREALDAAKLGPSRTLLASGNVICVSTLGAEAVKTRCEKALRDGFGYDAWVVVLGPERLDALIEACPYPAESKAEHAYVTLSSDPSMLDELMGKAEELPDTSLVRLGPEALAWKAPVGGTLDSAFSKLSSKPRYKSTTTTRNLRTLLKMHKALGQA